jgi:hypothetical protein
MAGPAVGGEPNGQRHTRSRRCGHQGRDQPEVLGILARVVMKNGKVTAEIHLEWGCPALRRLTSIPSTEPVETLAGSSFLSATDERPC